MANSAENTPFLSDNEQDEYSYHHTTRVPANKHFKRSLNLLSILTSFLSLSVFGLLISAYVLTKSGPFWSTWSTEETIRRLLTVLFITFLLSTPTIFFTFPIVLKTASDLAMSIAVLVIAPQMFGRGWPDSQFCTWWSNKPPYGPQPEQYTCILPRNRLRVMIAVAGGLGIFVGVLLLTSLLLRIIAISRTKFWVGKGRGFNPFKEWNPTGFTVKFSLSVLPNKPAPAIGAGGRPAVGEQEHERLIET